MVSCFAGISFWLKRCFAALTSRIRSARQEESMVHSIADYPSVALLCYVRHTKEAPDVKKGLNHVKHCQVCQAAFDDEVEKRLEQPQGRGWWTGDDPYLAKEFGVYMKK